MRIVFLFATMAITGTAAIGSGCAPPEAAVAVSLCEVVKDTVG